MGRLWLFSIVRKVGLQFCWDEHCSLIIWKKYKLQKNNLSLNLYFSSCPTDKLGKQAAANSLTLSSSHTKAPPSTAAWQHTKSVRTSKGGVAGRLRSWCELGWQHQAGCALCQPVIIMEVDRLSWASQATVQGSSSQTVIVTVTQDRIQDRLPPNH